MIQDSIYLIYIQVYKQNINKEFVNPLLKFCL